MTDMPMSNEGQKLLHTSRVQREGSRNPCRQRINKHHISPLDAVEIASNYDPEITSPLLCFRNFLVGHLIKYWNGLNCLFRDEIRKFRVQPIQTYTGLKMVKLVM